MSGDAASHEHLTSHAERATQRLRQVADTLRHTAPVDALPAATAVLDSILDHANLDLIILKQMLE